MYSALTLEQYLSIDTIFSPLKLSLDDSLKCISESMLGQNSDLDPK
jgi:hypothetical protein